MPCKTYINSHIAQLWPTHRMIEVIFAEVVLGQIRNIGELDMWYVRRSKHTNIHLDGRTECSLLFICLLPTS